MAACLTAQSLNITSGDHRNTVETSNGPVLRGGDWGDPRGGLRRCLGEVSVDGGAGDAELVGDLGDGVFAFAVVAGLLVHLASQLNLTQPEFRLLAAGADEYFRSGQLLDWG